MSLNPLNELKRRLDDDSTPLPKRLCLAKNVVQSHHFPTAPKERVIGEWLEQLIHNNGLSSKELMDVLAWLDTMDDLTSELKNQLIQVVSKYLQLNPLQDDEVQSVVSFLENPKISPQLTLQIEECQLISVTILKHLRNEASSANISFIQRILNNLVKYYKECKRKLEFIVKLLDGENLETVFSFLDTECHNTVINVCQNILFPLNKKSFFVSYLQTLIRKDNIEELIAEKGDNIQSVVKIMNAFFSFPKGRTGKDQKFLSDFVNVFVSSFRRESQLIFAFYIMVVNSLNMVQNYLNPAMQMTPIVFEEHDDKVKRNLFVKMLEILLQNEVDISVRLTDTFGEKISKVEIKKNFTSFLQSALMGQLKLEGKLDKNTLQIIKTALKLDPMLIEQKMNQILPPIMTVKKSNANIIESYTEMMNCLIEILFKLSRGPIFVNQILPNIKLALEASNTEQFELKQKVKECEDNNTDCEKLKSKIITGYDILPEECVEMYGKCTSELMFRQNKELLVLLQKDLEETCLMMLKDGFVSPSIITLAEVLSAILSSFLRQNKMADHTVPRQIAEDFWASFQKFEDECLKKFGECVLKLQYNPILTLSFLKLCLCFAHLKLLNLKYGNTKVAVCRVTDTSNVFDLSAILPCLDSEQWMKLAGKITEDEAVLVLDNLLLAETTAINLLSSQNPIDQNQSETNNHLIRQLTNNSAMLETKNDFAKVLFTNIDKTQLRHLAKSLVKSYLNNTELEIFKSEVIMNKSLLNTLVLEVARSITKCMVNTDDLSKALNEADFDLIDFLNKRNVEEYFNRITLKENQESALLNCVEALKQLPICYLEESYQLIAIFVLLVTKKCCHTKKLRKNIDHLLQNVYELSPKYPDVFKIFPVEFIFSFEDKMLELLTLKIKTSNNIILIKCILESAVKKVKTNSEVVKSIVKILLSKQTSKEDDVSNIEYFNNPAFQISCIILPIIAKEKKAITTSNYRSILANLQEKIHKSMVDCFKKIDFGGDGSLVLDATGNIDDSMVVSDKNMATLNAMGAYALTLSRYCETTDVEEIKNLDCLWAGLEFFVKTAISSIQNPTAKSQHIEFSVQLLNVTLRHIKKLDNHPIFQDKDQLSIQIWKGIIALLLMVYEQKDGKKSSFLEDVAVTLKFLCELTSVAVFTNNFVGDLSNLGHYKSQQQLSGDQLQSQTTPRRVSKYLLVQCLKSNIVGPKCTALTKLMFKTCKALRFWIQQYLDSNQDGVIISKRASDGGNDDEVKVIKIDDSICDLLRIDLEIVSETILAAKKITLDYKFLDSIFSLQHLIHRILGLNTIGLRCEVTWQAFFMLFEGCVGVLNSLLVSREELLEDRWPCFMQCYRPLVSLACSRAAAHAPVERPLEKNLAEVAHSIEKLTQSICKRKTHISRISAYTVADICVHLETSAPPKMVRQHLENAAVLLIQASDSTHAMAFLRRALAGTSGQMTMTNLYNMYKRYHKYVGNA